jgi:hypothetical protein
MSFDTNNSESIPVVEINPQPTQQTVEAEMVNDTDEIKRETAALIEAIRNRAQSEAQSAGNLTRETYLNTLRRVRQTIEGEQLIERHRLENAFQVVQSEAEKNWEHLLKQLQEFGERLQDAAKAAWDAFNAPRHSA